MGEKFSWSNLLGKKKKADNTIEFRPEAANQDLVVPLKEESSPVAPPPSAGIESHQETGDQLTSRPPLVIDWESSVHTPQSQTQAEAHRGNSQEVFAEAVKPELVGAGVGHSSPPAVYSLFPMTLDFDQAMDWLDEGNVSDFQAPKVEHKPEVLAQAAHEEANASLAAKPNLGWDDVELTPAEQEAFSFVQTPEQVAPTSEPNFEALAPTSAPTEELNEWEQLRANHFDNDYVPVSIPSDESAAEASEDEPVTFELGEATESLSVTLSEVSEEYSTVPPPIPGTEDGGPVNYEIDPPVEAENESVEFEAVDTFGEALLRIDESTAPVIEPEEPLEVVNSDLTDPLSWAAEPTAPPVAIDYSKFDTESKEESTVEPVEFEAVDTFDTGEATDETETHQMDEAVETIHYGEPELTLETSEEPANSEDANPEEITAEVTDEPVMEIAEPEVAESESVETAESTADESKPEDGIPDIFKKAMGIMVTPPAEETTSQAAPSPTYNTEDEPVYINPVLTGEASATPAVDPTPVTASLTELPSNYLTSDIEIDTQRSKDVRLGDLLIENRLITQRQLDRALERQQETKEKLGVILVDMQTISERRLLQVLAAQRGVSPWHLEENELESEVLALVPEEMCRVFQVLPVAVRGDHLILAMKDVQDAEAIESVRHHTGKRIEPALADEARLPFFIDRAFGSQTPGAAEATPPEPDHTVETALSVVAEIGDSEELTEEAADAVEMIVRRTIEEGIRLHASDIHFEPQEDHAEIRYRLDGQLMKMRDIPLPLVPIMTEQLLALGKFDPNSDSPQDGKTYVDYTGPKVGLRMAALPSLHGTRITMRVLDKSVGLRKVDGLGFEEQNLAIFKELIAKPYGLFLVTGPTGSGKTTTLYAAIDELKRSATNIMTCEDPVEYDIAGISQAEVNEKGGLDFGDHLKAILRQDPDVMLIGEIRDKDTAEVAIRAAMSGHMVLSTMHCNDAASAVPHLLDMGIDPFLLSSALVGTVSQRLIRVLCPDCKKEEAPTADEANVLKKYFGIDGVEKVWHACGCEKCRNTGYKGRTAVHEIVPVTEEVAAQIAERASVEQIKRTASYYGYLPMQQDAIARVLDGQTTVDEARRVLQFDTISKRSEPRTINLPQSA